MSRKHETKRRTQFTKFDEEMAESAILQWLSPTKSSPNSLVNNVIQYLALFIPAVSTTAFSLRHSILLIWCAVFKFLCLCMSILLYLECTSQSKLLVIHQPSVQKSVKSYKDSPTALRSLFFLTAFHIFLLYSTDITQLHPTICSKGSCESWHIKGA